MVYFSSIRSTTEYYCAHYVCLLFHFDWERVDFCADVGALACLFDDYAVGDSTAFVANPKILLLVDKFAWVLRVPFLTYFFEFAVVCVDLFFSLIKGHVIVDQPLLCPQQLFVEL